MIVRSGKCVSWGLGLEKQKFHCLRRHIRGFSSFVDLLMRLFLEMRNGLDHHGCCADLSRWNSSVLNPGTPGTRTQMILFVSTVTGTARTSPTPSRASAGAFLVSAFRQRSSELWGGFCSFLSRPVPLWCGSGVRRLRTATLWLCMCSAGRCRAL